MLNSFGSYQKVVVFGGKSDLANSILLNLPLCADTEIVLIGREFDLNTNFNFHNAATVTIQEVDFCDIDTAELIVKEIFSSQDVDLAIFAYAILPREDIQVDESVLKEVFQVNTLSQVTLMSCVAALMRRQKHGQILHISTVASIRPRRRNFVYGASKSSVDFFARGLQKVCWEDNVFLTILRPGFVPTKMTIGLSPAPFATTRLEVAKITARALRKKTKIVYSPRYLKGVMAIIRILPEKVFRFIDE
jgi:decaprenylphospho-beta-D-erythro-pentofuranosid-2-ulose 2-reductase